MQSHLSLRVPTRSIAKVAVQILLLIMLLALMVG